MTHFLLVHGTAHGAWCWRDLIPALEALGHSAEAIDLPSHGEDSTPLSAVTLDLYATAVLEALDRPTVLVGHSSSGFVITAAAEKDPSLIEGLVYLCAYMPAAGKSLIDIKGEAAEQPLKGALEMAEDRRSFRFRPERAEAILYQDCPPGTRELARARLGWQAVAPQATALEPTARSMELPRHYIVTRNDACIPPAHQREMAAVFPPENVVEMDTGHSPFFADPEGLARILSDAT